MLKKNDTIKDRFFFFISGAFRDAVSCLNLTLKRQHNLLFRLLRNHFSKIASNLGASKKNLNEYKFQTIWWLNNLNNGLKTINISVSALIGLFNHLGAKTDSKRFFILLILLFWIYKIPLILHSIIIIILITFCSQNESWRWKFNPISVHRNVSFKDRFLNLFCIILGESFVLNLYSSIM